MVKVAGIDSSTQSCKVVIVDSATGEVVRQGRASHPSGSCVDPEAWWSALCEAVHSAGGLDDVAAVSIAGQQHGMVALDANGRVVRDALLWHDTRSADAAQQLITEVGPAAYASRVGSVPVASFTATKLRWLRDAEPANAARVAAVALPHDWLTWRLRGFGPEGSVRGPVLEELTTDRSEASGTAYWSASREAYDYDLFDLALGHRATLPRVLRPSERAGVTPEGVVVGAGAGDNASAALGLGARAGDIVISIGTSGTVFAVTETPVHDATGTVAGFASADGLHLPLVATMNAARVLDAAAGMLDVSHEALGELALAAGPGAAGVVLQPYFEGERTPNRPNATATLFGLTLKSMTRENVARAAIEGLLCGLADGLDAIRSHGVLAKRILMTGGAAQNAAVQHIAAQVFDVPVEIPTPGEYVAIGAALQAAWTLTGSRPAWSVTTQAAPAPDYCASIRQQYALRL